MEVKYLWDTNTVIYYLQNHFPKAAEKFIDNTLNNSLPAISAISEIELMCWLSTDEKSLKILQNFINELVVFELEKNIKLKTAEIRKQYKIKLPDAVIAATSIENDLTLISRNVKDFEKLHELKIINPFELG